MLATLPAAHKAIADAKAVDVAGPWQVNYFATMAPH